MDRFDFVFLCNMSSQVPLSGAVQFFITDVSNAVRLIPMPRSHADAFQNLFFVNVPGHHLSQCMTRSTTGGLLLPVILHPCCLACLLDCWSSASLQWCFAATFALVLLPPFPAARVVTVLPSTLPNLFRTHDGIGLSDFALRLFVGWIQDRSKHSSLILHMSSTDPFGP